LTTANRAHLLARQSRPISTQLLSTRLSAIASEALQQLQIGIIKILIRTTQCPIAALGAAFTAVTSVNVGCGEIRSLPSELKLLATPRPPSSCLAQSPHIADRVEAAGMRHGAHSTLGASVIPTNSTPILNRSAQIENRGARSSVTRITRDWKRTRIIIAQRRRVAEPDYVAGYANPDNFVTAFRTRFDLSPGQVGLP